MGKCLLGAVSSWPGNLDYKSLKTPCLVQPPWCTPTGWTPAIRRFRGNAVGISRHSVATTRGPLWGGAEDYNSQRHKRASLGRSSVRDRALLLVGKPRRGASHRGSSAFLSEPGLGERLRCPWGCGLFRAVAKLYGPELTPSRPGRVRLKPFPERGGSRSLLGWREDLRQALLSRVSSHTLSL